VLEWSKGSTTSSWLGDQVSGSKVDIFLVHIINVKIRKGEIIEIPPSPLHLPYMVTGDKAIPSGG